MPTDLPVDVTQLILPTPWLVGPVNAYVLHGDPLTLVDAGPRTPAAREALVQGLAAKGLRVSDIELLVLTHQHPDHTGQAGWVLEESGAGVAAFHALTEELDDLPAMWERLWRFTSTLMARHGMSDDERGRLERNTMRDQQYAGSVRIDRPLIDGDTLVAGGRSLAVHHRPGHSPSDIVLHDATDGLLVVGDHLLARISSNPLSHLSLGSRDPTGASAEAARERPLLDYINSLRSTAALGATCVLPGHGPVFADPRALIDERIGLHHVRADTIWDALRDKPRTARDLVDVLWDGLGDEVLWLGVAEVIAHLDLLMDQGRIETQTDRGVLRSQAVQADRAAA